MEERRQMSAFVGIPFKWMFVYILFPQRVPVCTVGVPVTVLLFLSLLSSKLSCDYLLLTWLYPNSLTQILTQNDKKRCFKPIKCRTLNA